MSILQSDRPALDGLGYLLLAVEVVGIVAAVAVVLGASALPLMVACGVWIGLAGTSCFLRGYRRAREASGHAAERASLR